MMKILWENKSTERVGPDQEKEKKVSFPSPKTTTIFYKPSIALTLSLSVDGPSYQAQENCLNNTCYQEQAQEPTQNEGRVEETTSQKSPPKVLKRSTSEH